MKVKGNLEVVGQASASNLSGTNTGDQDLSGLVSKTVLTDTQDPTGFNRKDPVALGTLAFDDATRTFTHGLNGGNISFYQNGVKYTKSVAQSVQIDNTEGIWFIYYNTSQVLVASQTPWGFGQGLTFVAIVYWSVTKQEGKLGEERHGISMDWATHNYLHSSAGSTYITGFTPSVTVDGDGSLDAHAELQLVSSGGFLDEDIQNLGNDQSTFEIWYKDTTGAWLWDAPSAALVKNAPAGRPYYNQETATGVYALTEVGDRDFLCMHIFATNSLDGAPTIIIMGEFTYEKAGDARLGAESEISAISLEGLPSPEYIPIATVIIEARNSYGNTYLARVVSTDLGFDYVDWRTATARSAGGASASDHGALAGLLDDDHLQYHTDARALTWLGTRTTDDLPEGTTNKYNISHPLVETAVPLGAVFTDTVFDDTNVAYTNLGNNFSVDQTFLQNILMSEDKWIGTSNTHALTFDGLSERVYLNSRGNAYINIDSNNNSSSASFIVAKNNSLSSGTPIFTVNEDGNGVFTGTVAASNLSGTNTGDNAVNSLYSGLVSNIPTQLSVGTVGVNTIGITSDGSVDDVIIPAATVSTAGLLTTTKWAEIVANNAKISYTDAAAVALNTAKVTNADHTGEVAGATALTVQPTAISNKTAKTTLVGTEEVLINDAGSLKKATAQAIADLASGGGATIIIDDVAPTVTTGGLWYNPSTNGMAVGVDGYWVVTSGQAGTDGADGADGADATAISGTGTVISLTEIGGAYYNMSSASTATTYTTTGTTLGAFACVLINTTSEPTVTGATKIAGSTWVTGTDMHMWVQYFGATVQYYFTEL